MSDMAPVRVLRLAAGGDGVGRLADGRTVFVPRTAPGDLVQLSNLQPAKRFARARLARVIEPGPQRVEPPCPHYRGDDCGGCQLQHLTYPAQLDARRHFAGEALRRLARLEVPDPPIEPANQPLGYRTKLTLAAAHGRLGLHRYGRADAVFDLEWCHIAAAPLNEVWQVVRAARGLLPPGLDEVVLRLDRAGGRHFLARVGAGSRVWIRAEELARKLALAGCATVLWWQPEGGAPRVVAGRAALGAGEEPPAGVFEQVHPHMGDRVRAFAVEALGAAAGEDVWDLYAGVGETTAMLLRRGTRVESVEIDRRAVEHADRSGPPAGRHTGRVEDLIDRLPDPDGVILNPPRTGVDPRVPAVLRRRRPRRVVYVSCDPATLARDLVRLGSGYRLSEARCFDLFPQTAHVETVAVLERT